MNQSIRLAPKVSDSYAQRGNLAAERGDFEQALRDFERALELDENSAEAHRALAWLLATCPDPRYRDSGRALASAARAVELAPPGDCAMLDALAAAHADAGNFDEAVRATQDALRTAHAELAAALKFRLALYQQRQPYRNIMPPKGH
jgi:tetratricopeptide (TPR) repeat protein